MDARQYGDRLKTYGAALHAGDSAVVTLVKVKRDLIEFQLSGGGFGTFGDDTSTSVSITLLEKSAREKDLEKEIKEQDDPRRRRELERELDDLRDRRERDNRRLEAARAEAEERKRARIAEERLRGGSRFNLRYDNAVPRGITPNDVMAALANYIDFTGWPGMVARSDDRALLAQGDHGPRKGMTREQAEQMFGPPVSSSARQEGRLQVVTLVFLRGDEKVEAEFVEDILVRYVTASR
jgi:hypothetical protein